MWIIKLPLRVRVSKNKFFSINLNVYRNAHHQVLDKAKKEFTRLVKPLLECVPKLEHCSLVYVYHHGKGAEPDTNNVCSVADKFFCDALVEAGVLPDDGPRYVGVTTFIPGERDRDDPRIEVTIRSTNHEGDPHMKATMNINVNPQDVQQALKDFLLKNCPPAKNAGSDLTFIPNGDGSYDVRFDADLTTAVVPGKEAKAPGKATPAPSLPQVTMPSPHAAPVPMSPAEQADAWASMTSARPAEPKAAATPGPFSVPVPASPPAPEQAPPAQAEQAASAETPEPPAPGAKPSLFANLGRVTNAPSTPPKQ